jgi:hypothetical protein
MAVLLFLKNNGTLKDVFCGWHAVENRGVGNSAFACPTSHLRSTSFPFFPTFPSRFTPLNTGIWAASTKVTKYRPPAPSDDAEQTDGLHKC